MKYNLEEFPYRQSTLAYIFDTSDSLLLIHKLSYEPKNWSVPGGGIDVGENSEQAIIREVEEELSIKKDQYDILYKSDLIYKYDWPEDAIEKTFKKRGKYFRGQSLEQFILRTKTSKDLFEIKLQEKELDKYLWIEQKDVFKYILFTEAQEMVTKILQEYEQFKTSNLKA